MITSKHILLTLSLLLCNVCIYAAAVNYSVRGKVIDKQSRQPVAYANVVVAGIPGKGASTDSLGIFRIEQIPPGIYRFEATLIGYKSAVTSEYLVSASTPFIEIEIEEDENMLSAIVVTLSFPENGRKSGKYEDYRLAGDRKKSGRKPRYLTHRASLSGCLFLSHRL